MASYSLPSRYQNYLGAGNIFSRNFSALQDALPGILKKGLSTTATMPAKQQANPGLPDMSDVDKPASKMPLYIGAGVGAVLLLALVMGKKKRAPAAA